MSLVDGMLEQLKVRGLRVEYVEGDQLKLTGRTAEATPEIMAALKAFRKDLLDRLRPRDYAGRAADVHHPAPPPGDDGPETCVECKGHVWDREETADLCEVPNCPMKRDRHG